MSSASACPTPSGRSACRWPRCLCPLAFVISGLIILWSTWDTDWKLGVAILIGYAILVANRVLGLNPHKPMLEWRAASWLPVYLLGMGVIVYLSSFGPTRGSRRCPSAGTWSRSGCSAWSSTTGRCEVSLRKEQIEEMLEEVVLPEKEGLGAVVG